MRLGEHQGTLSHTAQTSHGIHAACPGPSMLTKMQVKARGIYRIILKLQSDCANM